MSSITGYNNGLQYKDIKSGIKTVERLYDKYLGEDYERESELTTNKKHYDEYKANYEKYKNNPLYKTFNPKLLSEKEYFDKHRHQTITGTPPDVFKGAGMVFKSLRNISKLKNTLNNTKMGAGLLKYGKTGAKYAVAGLKKGYKVVARATKEAANKLQKNKGSINPKAGTSAKARAKTAQIQENAAKAKQNSRVADDAAYAQSRHYKQAQANAQKAKGKKGVKAANDEVQRSKQSLDELNKKSNEAAAVNAKAQARLNSRQRAIDRVKNPKARMQEQAARAKQEAAYKRADRRNIAVTRQMRKGKTADEIQASRQAARVRLDNRTTNKQVKRGVVGGVVGGGALAGTALAFSDNNSNTKRNNINKAQAAANAEAYAKNFRNSTPSAAKRVNRDLNTINNKLNPNSKAPTKSPSKGKIYVDKNGRRLDPSQLVKGTDGKYRIKRSPQPARPSTQSKPKTGDVSNPKELNNVVVKGTDRSRNKTQPTNGGATNTGNNGNTKTPVNSTSKPKAKNTPRPSNGKSAKELAKEKYNKEVVNRFSEINKKNEPARGVSVSDSNKLQESENKRRDSLQHKTISDMPSIDSSKLPKPTVESKPESRADRRRQRKMEKLQRKLDKLKSR